MIDFEKEEFLQRLDMRIMAISGMLVNTEKYLASTWGLDKKKYSEAVRQIEKNHQEFLKTVSEADRQIQENFEKIKKEIGEE